jgi:hypothetical protein
MYLICNRNIGAFRLISTRSLLFQRTMKFLLRWIWGFHCGGCIYYYLLGCKVWSETIISDEQLAAYFLLRLIFDYEHWGNMFLWNFVSLNYASLQHQKPRSLFHPRLTFQHWRRRWYVPPKNRTELHGINPDDSRPTCTSWELKMHH